MGLIAGIAGMTMGIASSAMSGSQQAEAGRDAQRMAETSKILEAAFFEDEVDSIIAESARLVGTVRKEAGARGVKSTTGTAAELALAVRRGEARALRTAAQESVITRHGLTQTGLRARRAGDAASTQGGLAAAGAGISGMAMFGDYAAQGRVPKWATLDPTMVGKI